LSAKCYVSLSGGKRPPCRYGYYKKFALIALSITTIVGTLTLGSSFAFLKVNVNSVSAITDIVAFLATIVGFLAGRKQAN